MDKSGKCDFCIADQRTCVQEWPNLHVTMEGREFYQINETIMRCRTETELRVKLLAWPNQMHYAPFLNIK